MSDETQMAFGPLQARAAAMGSADRISLRDHVVTVEIGAFQQERGTTQRLRFDLVVEVAPHDGAARDDVDLILSYDTLTEAVAAELAAERLNLLETLADRIAARVLRQPHALRCFVRIQKLDRGPGALGVEIVRARGQAAAAPAALPPARVVFLSHAAQGSAHLPGWLSALGRGDVLCLDRPAQPLPSAATDAARRQIVLLAWDQQAWAFASHHPGCGVVATRTELDWALRQGNATVWAPAKIVLDATDAAPLAQGAALAAWFAARIGAWQLLAIGGTPPATGEVSIRSHSVTDPGLPPS